MRKGITKEQVINKALELMRDKEDIRSVNLRVIAREVGCAHTNLYNYFSSLDDLLRETYIEILERFSIILKENISKIEDYQLKLKIFFTKIIDFYLDNKGWFRLIWVEKIGGDKDANYIAASQTVDGFIVIMEDIWKHLYSHTPNREQIKNTIHVVHCYIYGEVSIYIANHSLFQNDMECSKFIPLIAKEQISQDETVFRKYVVDEAIKIFNLYLTSGGRTNG